MDGRLFEFVVSFCDGFGTSNVLPLDILAAHDFDDAVDKMTTVRVAFCEVGDTPAHTMENPAAVLSFEESQTYLKQYQVVVLPSMVIRPCAEGDQTPVVVVPLPHKPPAMDTSLTNPEDTFANAIAAYNNFNLSETVLKFGEVLAYDAHHKQALFNLASIMHMLGFPTLAVGYTVRLLTEDPEDTIAHSFLWALNNSGECTAAAVQAYRLLAGRGDLRAVTKLATLTGQGSQAARGDPQYAQQIYDDMGESFETKLVDHLGYRGPWLMHDMLEKLVSGDCSGDGSSAGNDVSGGCAPPKLRGKGDWRILDVGCGSGLCGDIFSEYVRRPAPRPDSSDDILSVTSDVAVAPLLLSLQDVPSTTGGLMVGIDVSAKMVEITARRGVYHCVERWDLTAALRVLDCSSSYSAYSTAVASRTSATESAEVSSGRRIGLDMVIAADTFIYVGALGEVFSLVHKVLLRSVACPGNDDSGVDSGGGLFMFSTEDLELSPMRVQTPGSQTLGDGDSHTEPTFAAPAVEEEGAGDCEIPGAVPGWGAQLLRSARFAHSDRYVRALCEKHRFRVLEHRKIVLRTEETIPLPGNIYILQKL